MKRKTKTLQPLQGFFVNIHTTQQTHKMTTPKRVENIFRAIKRGNIKLEEKKIAYSVYVLDVQNIKNINPKQSAEIHPTNQWVISVYYKGSLIAFMAFDADFIRFQFDYFYPFSNLVGNKIKYAQHVSHQSI